MGHRQSPILNDNKLKLGFFSPNCSGGMAVTKAPGRWVNSWENNIALAGNCVPAVLQEDIIVNNPVTGESRVERLFRAACQISFDGNKLERAPKHTFTGSVNYTRPFGDTLEGFGEIGAQWKDEQYVEYTNESWLGAYWNFDLRFGLRSDRWEILGYVENLLDDDALRATAGFSPAG